MAELSLLLKEHCESLADLHTVYIGHKTRGNIVAGYNPGHLNTDLLTRHTTEVMRSFVRLHSVVGQYGESSYFVSSNKQERLLVQTIDNTPYYVALISGTTQPLQSYVPTFKTLLDACQQVLKD